MSIKQRFIDLSHQPGKVYRQQAGRVTKAIQWNNQACFVKLHSGIGWREIIKNLLQGRLPIVGAKTEYRALKHLASSNILSLEPLAFEHYGLNPAQKKSFLITKALEKTESLETLCARWREHPPSIAFKRALIRALAQMACRLHQSGLNHRDFYLCHFLFDLEHYEKTHEIKLILIDLHRAQIRKRVPLRWQHKDIAGLYFSALDIPLTRRDLFLFMRIYQACVREKNFWFTVENKAWQLYEKTFYKKISRGLNYAVVDPHLPMSTAQSFISHPDKEMAQGTLVKDDATTTVVKTQWESQALIIKRYNVRSLQKGIKRWFGASRARRSWWQALRLRHLGIATPKPLLMLDRTRLTSVRESYIVMECLHGEDLASYLAKHPDACESMAEQMRELLRTFAAISTAHGDMKATNLWVSKGKIILLDLDGMRQYKDVTRLHRALNKDQQRLLKNWKDQPKILDVFQKALAKFF